MTELKPCPLCGGKANLMKFISGLPYKPERYSIHCEGCLAFTAYYLSKEEAAEAWNRRSPDWISVRDKLPDTDTMVIVAIYGSDMITIQESETLLDALNRSKKEFNRITMAFINEGYWCDTDGYPLMVTPSYWMPLPEPPEQKGETS